MFAYSAPYGRRQTTLQKKKKHSISDVYPVIKPRSIFYLLCFLCIYYLFCHAAPSFSLREGEELVKPQRSLAKLKE